ncbi:MAG: hypothetical protein NVSMB49_06810 [Ktedonobacteraceae bacterium]
MYIQYLPLLFLHERRSDDVTTITIITVLTDIDIGFKEQREGILLTLAYPICDIPLTRSHGPSFVSVAQKGIIY